MYQFGRRLLSALASDDDITWAYAECGNLEEMLAAEAAAHPDVILLNYVPFTMPWVNASDLGHCRSVVFMLFHEAYQQAADALVAPPSQYFLCPDPTLVARNPIALPVPRFIPPPCDRPDPEPGVFTVGSFGFATPGKGFDRLCGLVCDQCDEAIIRLNLPFHDSEQVVPVEQLNAIVAACRARLHKTGVQLEVTHHFFDDEGLVAFLAGNSINAFLYEGGDGRGISSCIDFALASGRPIAISSSPMFRHLHGINPSICVENRSLSAIAEAGTEPLRHHRKAYEQCAAGRTWNQAILEALAKRRIAYDVPDGRGFNKLLDDRSRATYTKALADLRQHSPEVSMRKMSKTNIQQAYALDAIERLAALYPEPRILAVCSSEDAVVAILRAKGYRLDDMGPDVSNVSLDTFYRSNKGVLQSYDLIFSLSVLEHVADDVTFIRMMADLLAPEGVAILTIDFSNRYVDQGCKPRLNHRLYTTRDLSERLMHALPDCALLDSPTWDDGGDEFEFDGCHYSFAAWVFRRLPSQQVRYAVPTAARPGAAWKQLIEGDRNAAVAQAKEVAVLDKQFAELTAKHSSLQAQLSSLFQELRLVGGPLALQLVLPLARLVRKIATTTGIGRSTFD